jgi:hypothetical protein
MPFSPLFLLAKAQRKSLRIAKRSHAFVNRMQKNIPL